MKNSPNVYVYLRYIYCKSNFSSLWMSMCIYVYILLVDIHIVQVDESLDTLENEVLHRFISFNVKLYGSNQNVNCFRFGANINCFT